VPSPRVRGRRSHQRRRSSKRRRMYHDYPPEIRAHKEGRPRALRVLALVGATGRRAWSKVHPRSVAMCYYLGAEDCRSLPSGPGRLCESERTGPKARPGLEEHFLSLAHAWRTFYETNGGLLRCQPLIPSSRVRRSTVPDRVESQSRTRPPYMGFSPAVTAPGSSVAEPATPGQIRSERAAQSVEILELGPE
jgi:hypothetical protein